MDALKGLLALVSFILILFLSGMLAHFIFNG